MTQTAKRYSWSTVDSGNSRRGRGAVRKPLISVDKDFTALLEIEDKGYISGMLTRAIRDELTELQRQYMLSYYIDGKSMSAVADEYGVATSTVSRTLKRGRNRLNKCVKYGALRLLVGSA